ncbi:DUF4365 domain-containing protein [Paraburkholderia sp. GAS199]|uniref:DUF4365 domain-containing protein n=1 Tax=Paraburkholderia sp. GAS199 TaxID=3035126 RepID=UPI003D1B86C3
MGVITLEPLPQESEAQRIGHRADKCFVANRPDCWRVKPTDGTDDVGLDYQIQLVDGAQYVGLFHVQLKGSESPALNATGEFYSVPLERSTVNYYLRIGGPVLLVFADLSVDVNTSRCPVFHVWIHDDLKRRESEGRSASLSDRLTFRVPVARRLEENTDVLPDLERIRKNREIANELNAVIEAKLPALDYEDRAEILGGLPTGLTAYNSSLILAVTEPATRPWPEAPRDSLPGQLDEADRLLVSGQAADAEAILGQLAPGIENALPIEQAEYWYCKGRVHARSSRNAQAIECFRHAYDLAAHAPRYVVALVEADLAHRVSSLATPGVADLLHLATGHAPEIQAVRARLLAIDGQFDEASAILAPLPRRTALHTQAVLAMMQGRYQEVIEFCNAGIIQEGLESRETQLFYLLRAGANFWLAMPTPPRMSTDYHIESMSGPAGVDAERLQLAWSDIKAAIDVLRRAAWPNNTQYLADIWCPVALMLGRAAETIDVALEAAKARPSLATMQLAAEMLAMHVERFDDALEANGRQPESAERNFRRIGILYHAHKYLQCLQVVEEQVDSLPKDHALYPVSVAIATLCADKQFYSERAEAMVARLKARTEWAPHAAVLDYFRAVDAKPLSRDEATQTLVAAYLEQGSPKVIAQQLLYILRPARADEAQICIDVAENLRQSQELSVDGEFALAQARTTREEWTELLAVTERAIGRFRQVGRFRAVRALALDKLGASNEALDELRALVELGSSDQLALDLYVSIVTRSGLVDEALSLAERLLEVELEAAKRLDCLWLVFQLSHSKEPGGRRAMDVLWQIGQLINQSSEEEEGRFLVTYFSALQFSGASQSGRLEEFDKRRQRFFDKWPESRILRSIELPPKHSATGLLEALKRVLGEPKRTPDWQLKMIRELCRGELPMPFSWRPNTVLPTVRDTAELWEIGKRSKKDDVQYHLTMVHGTAARRSSRDVAGMVPLLDLPTLFVIQDLELFGPLFLIFQRVAIAQSTLLEIQRNVVQSPFNLMHARFSSLTKVLTTNIDQILQPASPRPPDEFISRDGRLGEDVKALLSDKRFVLYSDDAFFRLYATEDEQGASGLCTLDLLRIIDELELLPVNTVAQKMGQLCLWNVQIAIEPRFLMASLPVGLAKARTVLVADEMIRQDACCYAILEGIWNVRQKLENVMRSGATLLRDMVVAKHNADVVIAGVLGMWLWKVRFRTDAGTLDVIETLAVAVAIAAMGMDKPSGEARQLWRVFRLVVELMHGEQMDEQKERVAIATLGRVCARSSGIEVERQQEQRVMKILRDGLTEGTADYELFTSAYEEGRIFAGTASSKKFNLESMEISDVGFQV